MLKFPVFLPVVCLASNVIVRNNHFEFNGKKLFLSGGNQAWYWYGYDFGNGDWWKGTIVKIFKLNHSQFCGKSIFFY